MRKKQSSLELEKCSNFVTKDLEIDSEGYLSTTQYFNGEKVQMPTSVPKNLPPLTISDSMKRHGFSLGRSFDGNRSVLPNCVDLQQSGIDFVFQKEELQKLKRKKLLNSMLLHVVLTPINVVIYVVIWGTLTVVFMATVGCMSYFYSG